MTNVYQASQLLFCLSITLKMPINKAFQNGVQAQSFKIFVHVHTGWFFLTVPPLEVSDYIANLIKKSFLDSELRIFLP